MTDSPAILDVHGEEVDAPEPEHGELVPTVAALVPVSDAALVAPVTNLAAINEAFHAYQEVCSALLTEDDYQQISGRSFRKKSAWRKLAVAFGVSCHLRERVYERNDGGQITRAEVIVRAVAPNGRYMDGLGACDISERRFSKPQHDIPATAYTRAVNRACADLFGMGEVSAEEMMDESAGGDTAGPGPRAQRTPSSTTQQGWSAYDEESVGFGFVDGTERNTFIGEFISAARALPPDRAATVKAVMAYSGHALTGLTMDKPTLQGLLEWVWAGAPDEPAAADLAKAMPGSEVVETTTESDPLAAFDDDGNCSVCGRNIVEVNDECPTNAHAM